MSYQVLARKWRPRCFAEMAGQEHVLQALINALDHNRLHHAYLFSGTRGVGKTTIARILSKCLNCEQGVRSVPCGECGACNEIAEGRFIDLIEVDAASNTGVDDMRDLLDNVQYTPSRGRFKIYLIDEVHMLSKSSFAALLKTLEEPPPHVKFLFATTDPQKLPVTILSRCLQFNLKNLSAERITQHLEFVLSEEKVPFEEAALWSLARAADGSMRDALSLTDQSIGHGGGRITEQEVNAMLGTIERCYVMDICSALASGEGSGVLAGIGRMAEQSPDYDLALSDILSIWHQVAILQTVPEALDSGVSHYSGLLDLASTISKEDVQLFYQICLMGRKDLQLASDLKSGFEMLMLRALAFRPLPVNKMVGSVAIGAQASSEVVRSVKKAEAAETSELSRPMIEGLNATIASASMEERLDGQMPAVDPEPTADNDPVRATASEPSVAPGSNEEAPTQVNKVQPLGAEPAEQLFVEPEPLAEAVIETVIESVPLQTFTPNNWIDIRKHLTIGASLGEIASHCLYLGRQGNQLKFLVDSDQSGLYDTAHQESLAEALTEYFNETVTVVITSGIAEKETPRAADNREKSERIAEAVEVLNGDSEVIKFKQIFDGSLDEKSVRSIDWGKHGY